MPGCAKGFQCSSYTSSWLYIKFRMPPKLKHPNQFLISTIMEQDFPRLLVWNMKTSAFHPVRATSSPSNTPTIVYLEVLVLHQTHLRYPGLFTTLLSRITGPEACYSGFIVLCIWLLQAQRKHFHALPSFFSLSFSL